MKILVVEDSVKLNEGIQLYLEEEGFNVEVAFNGVQALSKVKDLQKEGEEYDVIEETHTYYILQWSNGIKVGIGKELEGKTYELI